MEDFEVSWSKSFCFTWQGQGPARVGTQHSGSGQYGNPVLSLLANISTESQRTFWVQGMLGSLAEV